MIVVDANRIGTLYIQSSDSPTSVRVLKNDPDWYTPVLWQSEVGSIVTGYYRHNMILIDKAIQSTEEAQHLMMQHHRFVSSNLVFELVGTGNRTSYDCAYVISARNMTLPSVTFDRQFVREFPRTAVFPQDFVNL